MNNQTYTRTDLRKITGCPGYLIDYLNDCNRLPIAVESKGKGYYRKYKPEAVDVIKSHLSRQKTIVQKQS